MTGGGIRHDQGTDKYLIDAAQTWGPVENKPTGEVMNCVYDLLREMTVDELREFKSQAEVEYLATGNRNYALMAYQCSETYRRLLAGVW